MDGDGRSRTVDIMNNESSAQNQSFINQNPKAIELMKCADLKSHNSYFITYCSLRLPVVFASHLVRDKKIC